MARQYLYHNGEQIPLNGQDFWVGTHEQFANANPPIPKGTLLYFTDGEENIKAISGTTPSATGTILNLDLPSGWTWENTIIDSYRVVRTLGSDKIIYSNGLTLNFIDVYIRNARIQVIVNDAVLTNCPITVYVRKV